MFAMIILGFTRSPITLRCHSPLFEKGNYLLRNLAQRPDIDCEIRGLVIAQHHRRGGKASAIGRPGEVCDLVLGVNLAERRCELFGRRAGSHPWLHTC